MYGLKFFPDWNEVVGGGEVETLLEDIESQYENGDWYIRRDKDHPLQVITVRAELPEEVNVEGYDRYQFAEKIADEEGLTREDILETDSGILEPREEDAFYEFVILDRNPEYSLDFEDDYRDISEIPSIGEATEIETELS